MNKLGPQIAIWKNCEQTGGGFSWPNVLDAEVPDEAPADDADAFPTDAVID